ncbi:MAG: hypothetical protein V4505_24660, partial [Pseudomonadota bacterium]
RLHADFTQHLPASCSGGTMAAPAHQEPLPEEVATMIYLLLLLPVTLLAAGWPLAAGWLVYSDLVAGEPS